jgi:hypothetical protein
MIQAGDRSLLVRPMIRCRGKAARAEQSPMPDLCPPLECHPGDGGLVFGKEIPRLTASIDAMLRWIAVPRDALELVPWVTSLSGMGAMESCAS